MAHTTMRARTSHIGRRCVRGIGLALVVAFSLVSCDSGSSQPSSGDVGSGEGCDREAGVARDVPYASHPGTDPNLTSLDVSTPARPDCGLVPVVVWVHGGGWRRGDKGNQMSDKVDLFNGAGYVLVSVNYRLTDAESPDPVRYPVHNQDVAEALAWVVAEIADYGGDAERLAVLGHSAGAGIAAAVATDPRYLGAHDLDPDAIDGVGAFDTEAFDVARVMEQYGSRARTLYREVFGDDPDTWAEASPITYVEPGQGIPPFLLVRRGAAGRRAMVDSFADKLRDAGIPVTVIDAGSLTHREVNRRIGAPGDEVMTPPLMDFLARCFAGDGDTRQTVRPT